MTDLVVGPDDPRAPDIAALLQQHLELMRATTPPEFVFALDVGALVDPAITFCSARRDGIVLGIGALKQLDQEHGELKSMHTTAAARGQGIGAAVLDHLVGLARHRRYRRLSLETGVHDAFAPARGLYATRGFAVCAPFGSYPDSGNSVFMTLDLATA